MFRVLFENTVGDERENLYNMFMGENSAKSKHEFMRLVSPLLEADDLETFKKLVDKSPIADFKDDKKALLDLIKMSFNLKSKKIIEYVILRFWSRCEVMQGNESINWYKDYFHELYLLHFDQRRYDYLKQMPAQQLGNFKLIAKADLLIYLKLEGANPEQFCLEKESFRSWVNERYKKSYSHNKVNISCYSHTLGSQILAHSFELAYAEIKGEWESYVKHLQEVVQTCKRENFDSHSEWVSAVLAHPIPSALEQVSVLDLDRKIKLSPQVPDETNPGPDPGEDEVNALDEPGANGAPSKPKR